MYKIDSLNISNNPKISQGFKDALGVEDLTNVTMKAVTVNIDIEAKTWTIGYKFTAANFVQYREIKYKPSDLSGAEKTWLLDIMDKSEAKGLTEAEFINAVKL